MGVSQQDANCLVQAEPSQLFQEIRILHAMFRNPQKIGDILEEEAAGGLAPPSVASFLSKKAAISRVTSRCTLSPLVFDRVLQKERSSRRPKFVPAMPTSSSPSLVLCDVDGGGRKLYKIEPCAPTRKNDSLP